MTVILGCIQSASKIVALPIYMPSLKMTLRDVLKANFESRSLALAFTSFVSNASF